MHSKYAHGYGLKILAFPCNQFGKQEPGTLLDVIEYAAKHRAEFDIFSKIEVNGPNAHPLYKYLKSTLKGNLGDFIKWNYAKFLCDSNGVPVKRYSPTTQPLDIVPDMESLWSSS